MGRGTATEIAADWLSRRSINSLTPQPLLLLPGSSSASFLMEAGSSERCRSDRSGRSRKTLKCSKPQETLGFFISWGSICPCLTLSVVVNGCRKGDRRSGAVRGPERRVNVEGDRHALGPRDGSGAEFAAVDQSPARRLPLLVGRCRGQGLQVFNPILYAPHRLPRPRLATTPERCCFLRSCRSRAGRRLCRSRWPPTAFKNPRPAIARFVPFLPGRAPRTTLQAA